MPEAKAEMMNKKKRGQARLTAAMPNEALA
jgi:hypothetical protein